MGDSNDHSIQHSKDGSSHSIHIPMGDSNDHSIHHSNAKDQLQDQQRGQQKDQLQVQLQAQLLSFSFPSIHIPMVCSSDHSIQQSRGGSNRSSHHSNAKDQLQDLRRQQRLVRLQAQRQVQLPSFFFPSIRIPKGDSNDRSIQHSKDDSSHSIHCSKDEDLPQDRLLG